jgi:hypothetical protein
MAYPYPINPASSNCCTDRAGGKQPVFSHGSDLYVFGRAISAVAATITLNCFKSSDGGATWSIQDAANAPVVVNSEPASDWSGQPSSIWPQLQTLSSDVVLIPFCAEVGGVYGELQFVFFNLSLDLWSPIVTGGPQVIGTNISDYPLRVVMGNYSPATNKFVFVYQGRVDPTLPAPQSYKPVFTDIVEYDNSTSTWGIPQPFAGISGVTTHNCLPREFIMDPATGKAHVLWVSQDWGSTAIQFQKLYHQLYDPATSTIGPAELISTGTGVYGEADAGLASYGPAVEGIVTGLATVSSSGLIAFPYFKDQATPNQLLEPWPISMVVAQMADSPTWTEYEVPAAAAQQATTGPYGIGGWQVVNTDTGFLRGYWSNPAHNVIQVADFDPATLTWGAITAAYTHPTANFGDYLCVTKTATTLSVTATNKDALPHTNQALSYWQFSNAPPPTPVVVPPPPPVPPGGYPIWPPIFRYPNEYDKCLERWKCLVQSHPIKDASRCVKMVELWGGSEIPTGAKEFWEAFKIITPAPGQDYLVGSFRVPNGYNGMLYGIHVGYTGTGFVDGSGDIIWRIMIGNAWAAPGLGRITTKLGSPHQLLQITDYIKLKSNQTVSVLVNVPNASGNIQVGVSRILATLQGWYYPMK